jgi:uncharacterized protein YbjT (DUF2867 family)
LLGKPKKEVEVTMNLILFGATGMVGSGALREALADSDIEAVLSVGRKSCGVQHSKLRELIIPDLYDFKSIEKDLIGWDSCMWALGISSIGLTETQYAKVTEELTLLWARALVRLNPKFSFSYCSAMGAGGSSMWARVRQRVEHELKDLPFRHVGIVRPGFIQPGPGIRSKVKLYQAAIVLFKPLFPLLVSLFPGFATTSERLGKTMLRIVQGRTDKFILESTDINTVGK